MKEYLLLLGLLGSVRAQPPPGPLESYNIDPSELSVSGFSAGGAMAAQFHAAYSAFLKGHAQFAGASVPFCALINHDDCTWNSHNIDMAAAHAKTAELFSQGHIDDPSNMAGSKVWLFFGVVDGLVDVRGAAANELYFSSYTAATNIFKYDTMDCEHGIPTYDFGVPCPERDGITWGTYLNLCVYDGPYESLEFIHGGLARPDHAGGNPPPLDGEWLRFDQSEFVDVPSDPINEPWDDVGWIYVPSGCVDKLTPCKAHMHFHGCGMGQDWIGDIFVKDSQFPFVAEINDMILVYPQIKPSDTDGNGCWDWWGHNSADQSYKTGPQMLASKKIFDRLMGNF